MKYEQDAKIFSRTIKKLVFGLPAKLPRVNNFLAKASQMYLDTFNGFDGYMKTNGEAKLIRKVLKNSNDETFRFIDAGCNIGTWTLTLLEADKKCKIEGHLFEISEKTIQLLLAKEKIRTSNISVNNLALSDVTGIANYLDYGVGSGVNTLIVDKPFHKTKLSSETVNMITGDTYLLNKKIQRINLCKIDVEGFEASVIRGFTKSLSEQRIDVIQFEYGYLSPASGGLLNQLYELFEIHGYKIGRLTNHGVDFREFQWIHNDFRSGPNYVACLPHFVETLSKF